MTARLPVQDNAAAAEAASVKISSKKATLIKGQSKTLKISGTKSKVTWSSSKKSVAAVNQNGKITAKRAGTITITAKVNGEKYICVVKVSRAELLHKTSFSLREGGTYKLKATVSPSNAAKKTVKWSSSRKSVATVDAKGNVKAVGPGTAVITAKAGTKSAKCTVNLHTPAGQAYHRPVKVWRAYLASLNACRLSGGGLSE